MIKNPILQKDAEAFFQAEADLRAGYTRLSADEIAAALGVFHRSLVAAKPTLDQYRELAAQFAATLQAQAKTAPVSALNSGIIVRAACVAGLLPGIEVGSVDTMTPGAVLKLAGEVSAAIGQAFELPGE
jgi:hypothetical protein